MTLGNKIPDHVAAMETVGKGTKEESFRYHCFLKIQQRDEWVCEDREHRCVISFHHPRVLQAWDAFSVVLHPDPKAQRRLWNS